MTEDDFPPDARTGSTQTTAETPIGMGPYTPPGAPGAPGHYSTQPARHPQQPQVTPPQGPPPAPSQASAEAAVYASELQHSMTTQRYFDWINFVQTQAYNGIAINDMDRMDLMAALGAVIGDLYQMEIALKKAQGAPPN